MDQYKHGGFISGKAKVEGDSPKNDVVNAKLSPGEIVVDRETIAKGAQAILKFVMTEIEKHHPSEKRNFYDGGTANSNYQQLSSYYNPQQGGQMPQQAANISKPIAERMRQLEAIQSNLRPLRQDEMSEYNTLKAQSQSFWHGGLVQKMNEGGTSGSSWDQEPPTKEELGSSKPATSWDAAHPTEQELIDAGHSQQKTEERPWYDVKASNLGPGFIAGLKKIDEYTGAPMRKYVTEKVTGEKLNEAPTGAEQAIRMGAPTTTYGEKYGVPLYLGGRISPADIYGVGLELAQDPLIIGGKLVEGAKGLVGIGREVSSALKDTSHLSGVQRQAAESSAEASAKAGATITGGGLEVEQGGKPFSYNAPKNLEELNKWNPPQGTGQLIGSQRLEDIEKALPDLETKPLNYHYDMMENPKAMKDLKLQFENLPTDSAKKIAAYNQSIIDESANKIKSTIQDMTGSEPKNVSDSGHDLISTVKDKYNAEKESLGPIFESLQKSEPLSAQESKDLIQNLGENSKIGKLLVQDPETGRFALGPNKSRYGLSDEEHKAIGRVIDDLNDGMSFKEMQNSREYLRKLVDPANPGATPEINKVRSLMLGQLEDMAKTRGEDVGAAFKDYAVNERTRENFEKIIGGNISELDKMYAANPDNVVKKIFSNPNYTQIVSDYVGPEKMNEMTQSFINSGISKAYDPAKGFDPSAVRTWMKNNQSFLARNADPEVITRLNALADYGYYGKRFLDEVNPSGTAASLKQALEPGNFFSRVKQHGIVGALEASVAGKAEAMTKQRQAIKAVNESLGTTKPSFGENLNSAMTQTGIGGTTIPEKYVQGQATAALGRGTIKQDQTGPQKWYADGTQNLMDHAQSSEDKALIQSMKNRLLSDPKGQQLLIEASSLKPGSKNLDRVLKDIRGMK